MMNVDHNTTLRCCQKKVAQSAQNVLVNEFGPTAIDNHLSSRFDLA